MNKAGLVAADLRRRDGDPLGTLYPVGKFPLGLRTYMYWACADCGTWYPEIDGLPRCNGSHVLRCPCATNREPARRTGSPPCAEVTWRRHGSDRVAAVSVGGVLYGEVRVMYGRSRKVVRMRRRQVRQLRRLVRHAMWWQVSDMAPGRLVLRGAS